MSTLLRTIICSCFLLSATTSTAKELECGDRVQKGRYGSLVILSGTWYAVERLSSPAGEEIELSASATTAEERRKIREYLDRLEKEDG